MCVYIYTHITFCYFCLTFIRCPSSMPKLAIFPGILIQTQLILLYIYNQATILPKTFSKK